MNAKPLRSLSRTITILLKRRIRDHNKQDKIREGQILLDEKEDYKPLSSPMALETSQKAKEIINDYKTFKQTTGTMIPLVYIGSIVI